MRDFLKTKAQPSQIAEALSLCAASVERIEKISNDCLYHIEITTNRPDMASIYGLAREAAAVLPRFGFKAELKSYTQKSPIILKPKVSYLDVKITDDNLCPRFAALLLENIEIKQSPPLVRERLEKCGIRALNNVVDISNYVMFEIGQPMHTFDYDKILGHKMLMRPSKKGESIITLDKIKRGLPEGSIIVEDADGRIIDLCGIMGGANSAIDSKTRRVLLFVQTYDPVKIRQTCQRMAFRTDAASLFEKSLDPENVTPALIRAAELIEKHADAKTTTEAIDIYPKPYKPLSVRLTVEQVEQILGVKIPSQELKKILDSLNFKSKFVDQNSALVVNVPSYRAQDISIPQDLIEEVARIYGYHNLPSLLPVGEIPQTVKDPSFFWEEQTKTALKYWGLNETYTYSMVSGKALENCGIDPQKTLKISNPLTEDLVYMRPSLIPNLLLAYQQNQFLKEDLRLFELSKIYLPKRLNLPDDQSRLCALLSGERFLETKGLIESLLNVLGITSYTFMPNDLTNNNLWHRDRSAMIKIGKSGGELIGMIGEVNLSVLTKFDIRTKVTIADLDFTQIVKLATKTKKYQPIPKYPPIIEDISIVANPKILTGEIITEIRKQSNLIKDVSLLDQFETSRTFHIIYQHPKKSLTSNEVAKVREKIIKILQEKFEARVKE